MTSRRNFNYNRLAVDEDDYQDDVNKSRHDPRFNYTLKTLITFLGHMEGESSQAYGLLGLGLLTFLPGFYETRIACYSWRGAQGYRFRQFMIIEPYALHPISVVFYLPLLCQLMDSRSCKNFLCIFLNLLTV